MKKNIKLTNREIYFLSPVIKKLIQQNLTLPIKASFFLDKNNKILYELAIEIEEKRQSICKQYGTLNQEKNIYEFANEVEEEVAKKINELFDIEQEVTIYKVHLEDFGDINITFEQMQAISFMIEEEEND